MDRNRFVERLGKPGVASLRSGGQFATEQLVTIKRNGWSVSSGTAGQFERNTHSKDKDPEKGLSNAGKEDTRRIADVAKSYAIVVAKIVHSGKKRAAQTGIIFQDVLQPKSNIAEISGINPMDDVKAFGDTIDPAADLMVVGHLPFMEKLVSYLTAGLKDKRGL